jgi:uncharacterized membrane protein YfcA
MITKDRIRDFFHVILGISPSYLIFTLTLAFTFTNESKAFGVSFVSALLGAGINGTFNWAQGFFKGITSKRYELLIGALGGMFGGNLAMFLPNEFVAWTLFVFCIAICIWDLIRTKKQ